MSLKRLILLLLSLLVVVQVSTKLLSTWSTPQITNRLQLYQTDLILHASEFKTSEASETQEQSAVKAFLGTEPLKNALEEYQSVRKSAQENLEQLEQQFKQANSDPAIEQFLQKALQEQRASIAQIDLRIGIIQVEQGDLDPALELWSSLAEKTPRSETGQLAAENKPRSVVEVAKVLLGLWSDPPRLLPDAEATIQENLDGWFRYRTLERLYSLQQRDDALAPLRANEQQIAQQTLIKLAVLSLVQGLGFIAGIVLLIVLIVQRWLKGKEALLAQNGETSWETPWDWETIVQVLVVGFFFVGQLFVPQLLRLILSIGFNFAVFGSRAQAVSVLTSYLLVAGATLLTLYWSIKSKLPLPEGWFSLRSRSRWFLWGSGGYLVALPLMILVSLVNQQIWQGEGGSNPLLQIVLEERDPIALGIFLFTATIAAPVFEELLFRGFLLPSLTRYVSVGTAIALSSLVFAIAHLSLSEVLPLTVLGIVLGVVYTRSRNLLAPMLLHSLWNGVTMLGLFILGSGGK